MASNMDASSSSTREKPMYTDRDSRISKENLCMVLAVWMERFPLPNNEEKEIDPYRKVGAVLVLPNDMLHAVDCSRNGVHGVARLLMKHYDVAKDCKVFVSRKPCSFCTKLLVQCKVKRVFYLPIEPEYKFKRPEDQDYQDPAEDLEAFKDETSRVDLLFQTSAISQSVFVPSVGSHVLQSAEKRKKTSNETRQKKSTELMEDYWRNEEWIKKAKDDLPWSAFDENMKIQVQKDFESIMDWMARNTIGVQKVHKFPDETCETTQSTIGVPKVHKSPDETCETTQFDPKKNPEQEEQASHLMTLAKFLAERSDDPKTGVGAVITNAKVEIVAVGWNGFPTKALYGEFPRASHDDNVREKKYPYAIHAEQNALLMRNTKNLANGILFVTKTPCDECTPLLEMEGIKTVVLSGQIEKQTPKGNRTYATSKFYDKAQPGGVFTCYEMTSGTNQEKKT